MYFKILIIIILIFILINLNYYWDNNLNKNQNVLVLFNTLIIFFLLIKNLFLIFINYLFKNNKYENIENYISDIGPIFIKFCQWLSNRKDILGNELSKKLEKLQENNKIHDFEFTEDILNKYLHDYDKYIKINKLVLGSGSIAQVYKVKIINNYNIINCKKGDKVIIKIRHPLIIMNCKSSINLLNMIVSLLKLNNECNKILKTIEFDSFYDNILKQCDMSLEAKNLTLFKNKYNEPNIFIPRLYYSNEYFLIESYEKGYNINEFIKLYPKKKMETICLLWWTYFIMTIKYNLIHGDLHAGNFLFKINSNDEVVIILLDFGMINSFDEKRYKLYKEAFKLLMVPNIKGIIDFIIYCNVSNNGNINKFKFELNNFMDKNGINFVYDMINKNGYDFLLDKSNVSLLGDKYIRDQSIFTNVLKILNNNNIIIDAKYLNVFSSLIMLESYDNIYFKDEPIELLYSKMLYGKNKKIYDFENKIFIK